MSKGVDKPLKAYQVDHYEGPEEGSALVFAKSNAQGRRLGASELEMDWHDVSCHRSQQFDRYAPGPVPIGALIEGGWHFFCHLHECQIRIEEIDCDPDDYPYPVSDKYIVQGMKVFCSLECQARHGAQKRARAAAEAAMLELMDARFPGCTVTRIHICSYRLERSEPNEGIKTSACFTFPGAQYGGTYHFGEEGVAYVSLADREAFHRLYGPMNYE